MPGNIYHIIIETNSEPPSVEPSTTVATYSMILDEINDTTNNTYNIASITNTFNGENTQVLQEITSYQGLGEPTNQFFANSETLDPYKFVNNNYGFISTIINDTELSQSISNLDLPFLPISQSNLYGFFYSYNPPNNVLGYLYQENINNSISYNFSLYDTSSSLSAFNIDITSVEETSQSGVEYAAARGDGSASTRKTIRTISVGRSANAYGDVILAPVIYVNGVSYDVKSTKPHACAYSAITEVVIPLSYELIGRDSFRDCSKLTKIIFLGLRTNSTNPIVIEKNAFLNLPTKLNSSTPLTLYTSPLSRNNPVYDYFYKLYGDTINYSETPCFKEDTKILTDKGYVAIQDLRKGDMVKTLHDDYKAIAMIGSEKIHHNSNDERNRNQLFKYSSTNHPEVFEDLVITGGHSVLVDSLHENEEKETKQ